MPSQKLEKDIEMYKLAINLLLLLDYDNVVIKRKLSTKDLWASKSMGDLLNKYIKSIQKNIELKKQNEKLVAENVRLMKIIYDLRSI